VESLEPTVVVSQGLLRGCGIPTKRPQVSPLRYAPVEMTILLQLRFRISPGNSESHPQTALSSRLEESWACGPPKVIKNTSSGIHSLWNRYPFLVIPTGAKRSGGTCGSADPSWRCFSTERNAVERSAVSFLGSHNPFVPFSLLQSFPLNKFPLFHKRKPGPLFQNRVLERKEIADGNSP